MIDLRPNTTCRPRVRFTSSKLGHQRSLPSGRCKRAGCGCSGSTPCRGHLDGQDSHTRHRDRCPGAGRRSKSGGELKSGLELLICCGPLSSNGRLWMLEWYECSTVVSTGNDLAAVSNIERLAPTRGSDQRLRHRTWHRVQIPDTYSSILHGL